MNWITLPDRPGYLGKHRDEKYIEWNNLYGQDKWRLVWLWKNKALNFVQACEVYEEAYFRYLRDNRNVLLDLTKIASDVYDDSETNVSSGFDYLKQETGRTHIQDISIRRCLKRLNVKFTGIQLIQIRHNKGWHPLSMILSPGKVPFHEPNEILTPWLTGWWDPGTVECFYQSNRVLQIFK